MSQFIKDWTRTIKALPTDNDRSGFFDLPDYSGCTDPSHKMPSHMVIPAGKGYRHVCPACGKVSIAHGDTIRYSLSNHT